MDASDRRFWLKFAGAAGGSVLLAAGVWFYGRTFASAERVEDLQVVGDAIVLHERDEPSAEGLDLDRIAAVNALTGVTLATHQTEGSFLAFTESLAWTYEHHEGRLHALSLPGLTPKHTDALQKAIGRRGEGVCLDSKQGLVRLVTAQGDRITLSLRTAEAAPDTASCDSERMSPPTRKMAPSPLSFSPVPGSERKRLGGGEWLEPQAWAVPGRPDATLILSRPSLDSPDRQLTLLGAALEPKWTVPVPLTALHFVVASGERVILAGVGPTVALELASGHLSWRR